MSVIHQEDGHSYHYKVVDSADSMKKVRLCLFLVALFSLCSCSRAVRACVRVCGCVSVCLVLIMSLSLTPSQVLASESLLSNLLRLKSRWSVNVFMLSTHLQRKTSKASSV